MLETARLSGPNSLLMFYSKDDVEIDLSPFGSFEIGYPLDRGSDASLLDTVELDASYMDVRKVTRG